MKQADKDIIEQRAIDAGTRAILMKAVCASLAAVYKHGVSDLSTIDEDALDFICERAAIDGEFLDIQRQFLEAYSASLHDQTWAATGKNAPF